ncbi:hypothetical protein HMN09_01300600 [Mycena chlorophos]|uniref:glutathione transferase n=1 Tax=Mycena chlorophos TaxID=658473 RepID=A0A8H6S350_MYCCL|nr:hypothetical protein HMN09_01300600 [Mycena chlorophos]
MVVKLYGRVYPRAGTGLVALILNEKQVPFELIETDSAASKTDAHLARNPFGLVPVLEDDGVFIYETRAICRYIVDKYPAYGPRLAPGSDSSAAERAKFEAAACVEAMTFFAKVVELGREVLKKPAQGLPKDDARIAQLLVEFGATLDAYEKILSAQAYLTGDEISLVDLFHLITMPTFREERAGAQGMDHLADERRPNVMRWWKSVTSYPGWIAVREQDKIVGTA